MRPRLLRGPLLCHASSGRDEQGSGEESDEVTLAVPAELLKQLPAEVREDGYRREACLQRALAIGLSAISQASVSLDASVVRSEFRYFLEKVQRHQEETQKQLQEALEGQVTGEDSRLAKLLLEQVGDNGRLPALLGEAHRQLADPGVKESLPNAVAGLVTAALDEERERVSKLVDAADPNSPLGRFLEKQNQDITSLRSEYVHRVTVIEERLGQTIAEIHNLLRARDASAETEEAFEKSTAKGLSFEDAGYEALVRMAHGFGDRVESCGTVAVDGTARKVGDQLVHVCQPGVPEFDIVVEQKSGKCGRKPLLREMREALQFRSAAGAIGLMLRKHLGKRQAPYEQHGPAQVIVAVDWESEDKEEAADWFPLEIAYRVLRGQLVAAALKKESLVDVDDAMARITSVRSLLDKSQKVKRCATEARKNLDAVSTSVDGMVDAIRSELTAMEQGLRSSG